MSLVKEEWPTEVIPYMADSVFNMSIGLRELTGCTMVPSPVVAAHIRFEDSTSRHAVGVNGNKKATATDWFGRNDQATKFWMSAQRLPGLGGFGIYFDCKLSGEKRVMYHGDVRRQRLLWLCPDQDDREYIYYHKEPLRFLNVLGKEFSKL
jgi:hypothetical protein